LKKFDQNYSGKLPDLGGGPDLSGSVSNKILGDIVSLSPFAASSNQVFD